MNKRLVTTVRDNRESSEVRQFVGLPPELTGGEDTRQPLPWPRVLLVESKNDGIFLYRATEDGTFCGDTWHLSIDDAKAQAESEYGDLVGKWIEVPSNIENYIEFALQTANQSPDSNH
jgi:hypothetical protein